MAAIESLEGFMRTDKEIHGLNLVGNRDLSKNFHNHQLEVQLKRALQVVCWMKTLHGECLSLG